MDKQAWLKWRKQGIGGSDLPIIMGDSEFKTPLQLFEEKISDADPVESSNFVAERGNRFEPKIRSLFNLLKCRSFEPKLLQSEGLDFARVSLDGIDGDEIMEIKTVGKDVHFDTIQGIIPKKYKAQLQWALFVSGAKKCWYVSYWDEKWSESDINADHMAILEVFPDMAYIETIVEAAAKFWECVKTKKPPMASDDDFVTLKGLTAVANKWKRLKLKLEKIQDELDVAQDTLLAAAKESKHPRCEVAGLKIMQVSRIGNVDYKKVPQLEGINLDEFRGKGSLFWQVKEAK